MKKSGSGVRRLGVESLEERLPLAGAYLHNISQPLDVNDDGQVAPMDALVCINEINRRYEGEDTTSARRSYVDVDGDGALTPSDPLAIVNKLNRGSSALTPATMEARSVDGRQNNAEHPAWGAAGTALLRMTTASYADALDSPAGQDRPSARAISNAIAAQSHSVENERYLSDMVWQWGQFLDHDISLTPVAEPLEPMPIEVPRGDESFDPAHDGAKSIEMNRSTYEPPGDADSDSPRQQLNLITAFIDGSNVYGSDPERANALRSFVGGELKVSAGDLLPFNSERLDNDGGSDASLFLAGDVRANEQVGLIAMHTLFVREHNRLAAQISAADTKLSDEEVYQRARAVVIAELQAITYNEFLPALLGEDAMGEYSGYDDTINPGISNLFSTAAYRIGHSMLSPQLLRLGEDGEPIEAGHLPLRDAFFAPRELVEHGVESVLRGLVHQRAQEIDLKLIDDVRNMLFGPPESGGFDLASLNIQRGRDHGLPSYNQSRREFGFAPVREFAEITSDVSLQIALAGAYGDDVNAIDAWVGILAEDHKAGSSLGPLAQSVLVDQFRRLRVGDHYWYQRMFSGDRLAEIERTTLADVISRNAHGVELSGSVFFVGHD